MKPSIISFLIHALLLGFLGKQVEGQRSFSSSFHYHEEEEKLASTTAVASPNNKGGTTATTSDSMNNNVGFFLRPVVRKDNDNYKNIIIKHDNYNGNDGLSPSSLSRNYDNDNYNDNHHQHRQLDIFDTPAPTTPAPSDQPSLSQEPTTSAPSDQPSLSQEPTTAPSDQPSLSQEPTTAPSDQPSLSQEPSSLPSMLPSNEPTVQTTTSGFCPYEPSCETFNGLLDGTPLKRNDIFGNCFDDCIVSDVATFLAQRALGWECGSCPPCPEESRCAVGPLGVGEGTIVHRMVLGACIETCEDRLQANLSLETGAICGSCPEPEEEEEVCPEERSCTRWGQEGTPMKRTGWFGICLFSCVTDDADALDNLNGGDYQCGYC